MPERIQRKRTKGWHLPRNAVYVGRPTQWGNPFRVRQEWPVERTIEAFRHFIMGALASDPYFLAPLVGRDLCCWCPLDQPCHADVLLEWANKGGVI